MAQSHEMSWFGYLPLATLVLGATVAEAQETGTVDAGRLWTENCKACHGDDGKGGTKVGRMFGIKDLTDPDVKRALDREKALKAVKDGLVDEASGKTRMPAHGEKLSDAEIGALVDFVFALSP